MRQPWRPSDHEIELHFVRAQGAGGQNVNKVSSAVHLRFDIRASSLSEALKERLLSWPDQRVNSEGVVVIKAESSRSQTQNRLEAIERLVELVQLAAHVPKARRATRPTFGSKQRRLQGKALRAGVKAGRGKVGAE